MGMTALQGSKNSPYKRLKVPPPVANAQGAHPSSARERESSDHSVQRAELSFQIFYKENTKLGILSTDSLGYIKH
jgi:hypothetical protein